MGSPKQTVVQKVRIYNGKIVKPVLFNGRSAGMGKYFAAQIDGQLVCDSSGKPLKYKGVGILKYPE